jgi:hypothetical protein
MAPNHMNSLPGEEFQVVLNWHLRAKVFCATISVISATATKKIVIDDQ